MPLKKGRVKPRQEPPSTRDLEVWVEELSAPDPEVRRRAAVALEDQPRALDDLVERLAQEDQVEVINSMLIAILKHPDSAHAEQVFEMVRSDDAKRRTLVVDAIRTLPGSCTSFLRRFLRDEDPDVRVLTANTLQMVAMEEVETLLLEQLGDETDDNVVGAIVEALMEVGTSDAVLALQDRRTRVDEGGFLAFALDAAIKQLRDRGVDDA